MKLIAMEKGFLEILEKHGSVINLGVIDLVAFVTPATLQLKRDLVIEYPKYRDCDTK